MYGSRCSASQLISAMIHFLMHWYLDDLDMGERISTCLQMLDTRHRCSTGRTSNVAAMVSAFIRLIPL